MGDFLQDLIHIDDDLAFLVGNALIRHFPLEGFHSGGDGPTGNPHFKDFDLIHHDPDLIFEYADYPDPG